MRTAGEAGAVGMQAWAHFGGSVAAARLSPLPGGRSKRFQAASKNAGAQQREMSPCRRLELADGAADYTSRRRAAAFTLMKPVWWVLGKVLQMLLEPLPVPALTCSQPSRGSVPRTLTSR